MQRACMFDPAKQTGATSKEATTRHDGVAAARNIEEETEHWTNCPISIERTVLFLFIYIIYILFIFILFDASNVEC